ncbi:dTDP-4-dehydrorhamnose reductase [Gemmobacter megaterium]|uniref:dTDP-4-dehydrorhamnose reductase n=1 Tax=Gemmobacter megaterium TaxID=1086013 RepID=A0A1N7QHJ0_9RHOB|nr:dTDP-4-dehydrorhamnose reductase [Gemmobacter megaterium]GGE26418.1 NAD(P)-dependent oxidoreductase [Gemmobacter megaterium]SIT22244.1 dTDP-4-dehydrorhamnose reductase [Gemmobacter megaterium]
MRVLVFGRTGQVATELARRAGPGLDIVTLGRTETDLADPAACAAAIAATPCAAVINAAAYTAVDRAETEEALATTINAAAPGAMAQACADLGLPFLHVSTDYVFDGSGDAPWQPTDAVAPLNAYGRSKLAGEQAVRAAGGAHLILRTSWVYSAHGQNFVKTMLRLGAERPALRVVDDQWGGPTPAAAIADALLGAARALADGVTGGTYHFAGQPPTTWARFARETFRLAHVSCAVEGIATADYPTPARRPLNSRLDCATLTADFGITPPDWQAGLAAVLQELRA